MFPASNKLLIAPLWLLLFLSAILLSALPADARRKKSSDAGLTLQTSTTSHSDEQYHPYDTVAASPTMVRFFGYEKALRSAKESIFVNNTLTDSTVEAVWFTINYYDTSGNMLHKRRVRQRVTVPPGSTRRIDFQSWDTQRSFYYYTTPPTRATATPFKVSIDADTLLLTPSSSQP